jgi:hypothetical protein
MGGAYRIGARSGRRRLRGRGRRGRRGGGRRRWRCRGPPSRGSPSGRSSPRPWEPRAVVGGGGECPNPWWWWWRNENEEKKGKRKPTQFWGRLRSALRPCVRGVVVVPNQTDIVAVTVSCFAFYRFIGSGSSVCCTYPFLNCCGL